MQESRHPVRRSEKAQDERKAPLEGIYTRPVPGRLVRRSDGLVLQRCNSKRSGVPAFYLQDVTNRRYLGSIFTDNEHPEFDVDGVRYAIAPLEDDLYVVRFLRCKKGVTA